jgi:catalase
LKAGIRGPTLLEDFIFRQKLQRFDHERVSIRLYESISPMLIFSLDP